MDLEAGDVSASLEEPAAPVARLLSPDFGDPPGSEFTDPSGVRSNDSMVRTVDGMTISRPAISSTSEVRAFAERVGSTPAPSQIASGAGGSQQPQEPSVLDRFWRLGPDRNTRNLLGRPFEKLPNPLQWDLFGNRNGAEDPSQPPATVTGTEQRPPSTVVENINDGIDSGRLLSVLIQAQEKELDTWPQTDSGTPIEPKEFRRVQLNLRLLRLISDQPAAAAEAIDSMSVEEQRFWQELILGIARFRNPDESTQYDEHVSATIGQFNTAVRQLEPLASLTIRRLDFCSKIDGFGSIETFPTPHTFEPGERLLIYAEVDNLQSEVSTLGNYRTSFGGTLEIWSASSDEPVELELQTETEESATRRSDYYLSYEFTLPAHLPRGEYEIRLQIRDNFSSRTADSSLEFAVQ
ncbi:MAG: hypothetical protein MK102_08850 [Fuerstiella sp.]|nr:hypothetical protein [Fuerstiella sp.]